MRRATPLTVAAAALLLAACQSGKADTTGQSSEGFFVPSYNTLWDVTRQELNRAGFTADLDASSKPNRVMVSRWNTHLLPFSMKGWREQATLTLHPVEGHENYWSVEANVLRQNNKSTKDPSSPTLADWTEGERDEPKEQRIIYGIEHFFLGDQVSERFRTRYGMPAGHPVVPATPDTSGTPTGGAKPRSNDPLAR